MLFMGTNVLKLYFVCVCPIYDRFLNISARMEMR